LIVTPGGDELVDLVEDVRGQGDFSGGQLGLELVSRRRSEFSAYPERQAQISLCISH
jgi:hypothetical protein